MRKPNFFIVGAPRCGTTSMYAYLQQHPEIYMPRHAKEPNYFGTDFESIIASRFRKSEAEYLNLFAGATNEKRIGEATVHYLQSRRAASEIYAFNPASSIIIMLRNPVDMLHSYHQRLLLSLCEDIENFESALAAEEERRQGHLIPKNLNISPENLYYSDVVNFTEQIKRYISVFGFERIHIIIYDDMKQDTALVYHNTLQFLGVDTSFQPKFSISNAARKLRWPLIQSLLSNQHLIRMGDKVPGISLPVYRFLRRMISKPHQRESIRPELRRSLQERFRQKIDNLSTFLGRDLSHWYQQESE